MVNEKAGKDLGLRLLPSSSSGNPGKLLPTQSERAVFGVPAMTGNRDGSGPMLATEGNEILLWEFRASCARVPQVSCPLARALLSAHCFRIPPLSLSPRISAPHPTAPNRLLRLLRRGSPCTRPGPPSLSSTSGGLNTVD